jgi:gamma-glutamyltranspeptidase/glutathione hydrolase
MKHYCIYAGLLVLLAIGQCASADSRGLPGTTYNSEKGAVATVSPLATEAASKQLENGGNAIDAAIAAALTLGVADSYNSGIGGGLFALIRWADGQVEAVDGREVAPGRAYRDMYMRDGKVDSGLSQTGALAVGVPGSVAALDYLAKKGGRQPIATLYRDAAALAEAGFSLPVEYAKRLQRHREKLTLFPATAAIFLDAKQQPWPAGHSLTQKDLAKTYRAIAEQGPDYFYRGDFAERLMTWMRANNGLIDKTDMAGYEIKVRQAIATHFYGYTVYGFPPPSSGGVHVAQLLMMAEQLQLANKSPEERHHLLAEAMKLAFADRAYWLGDPDFVKVPVGLVDPRYTQTLVNDIDPKQSVVVDSHHTPIDADERWFDKHTTHIAVADRQGNWVAITTTLNTSFGSKVVIPGTGVLLNNQMDDFSAQPGVPNAYGLVGSEANSIQPGKRPLSSMSPTLVIKAGQPVMTLGAAGGPMIITQVTQGIINHLLYGLSLYDALAAPRIHHQWRPDLLYHDQTLSLAEQEFLLKKGHQLKALSYEGSTNGISMLNGSFDAVSEPRLPRRNQP